MPAWTIRPLRAPAELDGVIRIEGDSFTNPWTREMYLAELAHTDVARIDLAVGPADADDPGQDIAGFCSYWLVVDEVHINNLAVTPALRRQGVATALLRHLTEYARRIDARRILLEVRRSNTAALQLYDRFGFVVLGIRAAYYTAPVEDALVLALELT